MPLRPCPLLDQQIIQNNFSHSPPLFLISSSTRREEHHKGKLVPETTGVEEGSAKRNIQRKHSHDPHQKDKKMGGGAGGKGKWDPLDDGSMP